MKTTTLLLEIFILFLILLLIIFEVWVYLLKNNTCGNWTLPKGSKQAPKCRSTRSVLGYGEICSFAEISPDPSYKAPVNKLYIDRFYNDGSGANPFCNPMWYSYRYVNSLGGYSPLSPWTSIPIYAGATTLPCAGSCNSNIAVGKTGCLNNVAIMGTMDKMEYDTLNNSNLMINVHRQIGAVGQTAPDPNDEGEIVGTLTQYPTTGGPYSPLTSFFVDALCNTGTTNQCPSSTCS